VLLDWAHGQGNDLVESEPDDPKSIGHSSTFLNDTNDSEEIVTLLNQLAKEVSEEAKRKDYIGSTIQIVIKNSDFSVINRSETLLEATNDYSIIAKIAVDLLNHNYQGQLIRLIGVTLQNIVRKEDAVVQMSLFDFSQVEKENETRALISEINRKMKKDLLLTARDLKKKQER
jgi:DNA polymerase-4